MMTIMATIMTRSVHPPLCEGTSNEVSYRGFSRKRCIRCLLRVAFPIFALGVLKATVLSVFAPPPHIFSEAPPPPRICVRCLYFICWYIVLCFLSLQVLVLQEGRLTGIVTPKDLLMRVVAKGLDPDDTPVSAVMTPSPDTVPPSMTAIEALKEVGDVDMVCQVYLLLW